MEIESEKLDITPEMVILSRNVIRQYARQISPHDCYKCILYKDCESDFFRCPEKWKDIDYETDK